MKQFDLQDRLIDFSVNLIQVLNLLPNGVVERHLKGQLVRSGTSPALNYAEACDAESRKQKAESRKDFMHKIKIALKELRESRVAIKIIKRLNLINDTYLIPLLKEADELIAILRKSYTTAKNNLEKANH